MFAPNRAAERRADMQSERFLIALPSNGPDNSQIRSGDRPNADRHCRTYSRPWGGIALLAMLEAVREHWANMFGWLGIALIIDAIDGPLARRLDVVRLQPNWSGGVDLVVDFVTYVRAVYAITASGCCCRRAPLLGIGIRCRCAYFADRRMKASDNHPAASIVERRGVLFVLPPAAGLSTSNSHPDRAIFAPFHGCIRSAWRVCAG
jgi:hypothetical protein